MSEIEGEDEFMAHQRGRGAVPGGGGIGVGGVSVSSNGSGNKKKKARTARDERDELDESPAPTSNPAGGQPNSPNPRADKKRRTRAPAQPTGSRSSLGNPDRPDSVGSGEAVSPEDEESHMQHISQAQRVVSGGERERGDRGALAPIKPIGFAASRENRRESGGANGPGDAGLPSPVVMGFDFQKVDEDQLKTVRDTIGIKAQQEALIAQRRRDLAASTPNTPKELTFKGWQPKDPDRMPASATPTSIPGSGGVGRRREKTREKVERMSIVTAAGDKDVVPGSKSAPMNQNLSAQQSERGDPPSGPQTSIPSSIAPSGHHPNGLVDPRTAPMSNVRGSRADEGEFTRQQAVPVTGQYYRRLESGHSHNRSVTDVGPRTSNRTNMSASRGYDDRMPPPTAGGPGRNGLSGHSSHGHPGPSATYSHDPMSHQNSSSTSPSPPPPSRSHHQPHPSQHPHPPQPIVPTGPPQMSARREAFLAPYNQLYDLLHQADSLRYSLQDLMHRYEGLYAGQVAAMQEFKGTAASSNTLLGNLQQSAESLKEMVRYEISRANLGAGAGGAGAPSSVVAGDKAEGSVSGEKKEMAEKSEVEELKERIKKLEEMMSASKETTSG